MNGAPSFSTWWLPYLVIEVRGTVRKIAVSYQNMQALFGRELRHPAFHHLFENKPVKRLNTVEIPRK